MEKYRRTAKDKLKLLLFHKDERVTMGGVYNKVRDYDYSSYYPLDNYIKNSSLPNENVYDIRSFGAVADDESFDCAAAINAAFEAAEKTCGTVLVSGGNYTSGAIRLKSSTTFFIEKGSSVHAKKTEKVIRKKLLSTEKI